MNQHEPDYRYIGGMRVIECLQCGEDLSTVLNDLWQQRTSYMGSETYLGALHCLINQYFAFRTNGFIFSSKDQAVDRFLKRQPVSMSMELTRLLDGGDSTFEELVPVMTALTAAVWNNRHLMTFTRNLHGNSPH